MESSSGLVVVTRKRYLAQLPPRARCKARSESPYGSDPITRKSDLHEVSGPRVTQIAEHRQHLAAAAVQPAGHEMPVMDPVVVVEIVPDVLATTAFLARHQIQFHIIEQHSTYSIPVACVEQLCVTIRSRRRCARGGRWLECGRELLKPRTAAVQRCFHRRYAHLEHRGDLFEEYSSTSLRMMQLRGA